MATVKIWLPINETYSFSSKEKPKTFWLKNPNRTDVVEMDIPISIFKEWDKPSQYKRLLHD